MQYAAAITYNPSTCYISRIPECVFISMLEFLDFNTLCDQVSLVCRGWRQLWKRAVRKIDLKDHIFDRSAEKQENDADVIPTLLDLVAKCPRVETIELSGSNRVLPDDFVELILDGLKKFNRTTLIKRFSFDIEMLRLMAPNEELETYKQITETLGGGLQQFMIRLASLRYSGDQVQTLLDILNACPHLSTLIIEEADSAAALKALFVDWKNVGKLRRLKIVCCEVDEFGEPIDSLNDAICELIAQKCPQLEYLYLDSFSQSSVTDAGLQAIIRSCKSLACLILLPIPSTGNRVTGAIFDAMSAHGGGQLIKRLKFNWLTFSNQQLASLLQNLPNLRKLTLWDCYGYSDSIFDVLQQQQQQRPPPATTSEVVPPPLKLQSFDFLLSLKYLDRIYGPLTFRNWPPARSMGGLGLFESVKKIVFNDFVLPYPDEALAALVHGCPNLTHLKLHGMGNGITDRSVQLISTYLPHLQELEIHDQDELTNRSLGFLARGCNTKLTHLSFRQYEAKVTAAGFEVLFANDSVVTRSLTHIWLGATGDQTLLAIANNEHLSKNLTFLTIDSSSSISTSSVHKDVVCTEKGLEAICTQCKRLEDLWISVPVLFEVDDSDLAALPPKAAAQRILRQKYIPKSRSLKRTRQVHINHPEIIVINNNNKNKNNSSSISRLRS